MEFKQKAVEGVRWTSFTTLVSFCLGLIQIALISRYLSTEEIGMLSLVLVVIGIGRVFSDAGMSNALIHFQELNSDQINTLYWVNAGMAGLVSLVLVLLSTPIAILFKTSELSGFIRMMSVTIFIGSVGQQYYILLKKELAFASLALIDLLQRIVIFISVVVLLVWFDFGIWSVIYGTILGACVYAIASFLIGVRRFSFPSIRRIQLNRITECIRFGLFQMGDSSISYLSSNLDKLCIGRFFGMDILGMYELATILINRPITIVNPIFNNVSFPLFSRMQDDLPRLNQWYIKKIAIISLISAAIYCGMYAVKEELVLFLFGNDRELVAASLAIIFILGYFKSVSNPLGTYTLALGRPDMSLYLNLYQILVHISLLTIGVMNFTYLQTLILYTAGAILLTVPAEYIVRKQLSGMSVNDHLGVIIKHLLFGLLMAGGLIFIKTLIDPLWSSHVMVQLSAYVFIGGVLYMLLNSVFNSSLLLEVKALVFNR